MAKTIKIEIKNRWTGSVLFEYECEDNTMKRTVEEAVRSGANLSHSDLSGSDLSGSDLRDSNLSYSNLSHSDLSHSDLRGSDLRYSNLSHSDLSHSDLSHSDLSHSDLSGANLSGASIRDGLQLQSGNSIFRISDIGSRMGTTYAYNTTNGIYVKCGCFFGTLDEFAAKVEQTHGDNKHGKVYKAVIEVIKLRFAEE